MLNMAYRHISTAAAAPCTSSMLTTTLLLAVLWGSSEAAVQRVTPRRARTLMTQGYVYVDVRTPEEFASERISGSINIPYMFSAPAGRVINPRFVQQVQARFPTPQAARLLIGCATGRRSAAAVAALSKLYPTLAESNLGIEGWRAEGLPLVR